jgi:hypothetical protein
MRHLLAFAFAFLLTLQTAQAADISIVAQETPDHPAIILIKGQLMKEDYQKDVTQFSALAGYQKNAIVFLNSPGGQLQTALNIGLAIYQHGFSTAVADGTTCTSACALAWLGGKERFMGKGARIGFHSPRVGETLEISSVGNAMVGAYLVQVGIKDFTAIGFVTQARPEAMTWLNLSDAIRYHITAKAFSFSQDQWSWAQQELNPTKKTPEDVEIITVRTANGTVGRYRSDQPIPPAPTPPPPKAQGLAVTFSPATTFIPMRPQNADLISQALRHIRDGHVVTAREILKVLATGDDGSQGFILFALAETYDPKMLAIWGARDVSSDVVQAQIFYRRALDLGQVIARERLDALKIAETIVPPTPKPAARPSTKAER